MLSLETLVQQARQDGWAAYVEGRIDMVPYQVQYLSWTIVPSRRGGPTTDVLKPATAQDAPRQSLSATVGLSTQPLHTDGAHHPVAPDIILLSSETASSVPTLLWSFSNAQIPTATGHDLRHGLFTVRTGKDAFLAPALDRGRVRFDPGCMTPSDSRSSRVADYFSALGTEATPHYWTQPGLLLAIDNTKVLHARGSAEDEPDRSMHRISIRTSEVSK
jgi:hypothetical protein